jgi:nucleoid-associated protein YgaU
MRILHIAPSIDDREAEALAHYRASQERIQAQEVEPSSPRRPAPRRDTSAETDHVGQPMPRGSRLPERENAAVPTLVRYTVQRGDTLRGIADWFYGDRSHWRTIYAANGSTIRDPQAIEAGLVLRIPVLNISRQEGGKPLA